MELEDLELDIPENVIVSLLSTYIRDNLSYVEETIFHEQLEKRKLSIQEILYNCVINKILIDCVMAGIPQDVDLPVPSNQERKDMDEKIQNLFNRIDDEKKNEQ